MAGWHLPGGGVETGETIERRSRANWWRRAASRRSAPPALHGIYFNARVSRRDHVAVFVVRDFVQQGGPRHAREIIDHGFFAPDALPAETTRGTRARLDEVLTARRARSAGEPCGHVTRAVAGFFWQPWWQHDDNNREET